MHLSAYLLHSNEIVLLMLLEFAVSQTSYIYILLNSNYMMIKDLVFTDSTW